MSDEVMAARERVRAQRYVQLQAIAAELTDLPDVEIKHDTLCVGNLRISIVEQYGKSRDVVKMRLGLTRGPESRTFSKISAVHIAKAVRRILAEREERREAIKARDRELSAQLEREVEHKAPIVSAVEAINTAACARGLGRLVYGVEVEEHTSASGPAPDGRTYTYEASLQGLTRYQLLRILDVVADGLHAGSPGEPEAEERCECGGPIGHISACDYRRRQP